MNNAKALFITHLLFADDCFLFFWADEREVGTMNSILEKYVVASGQLINMNKSEVFFSRNVPEATATHLTGILNVNHVLGTGKYLGLPSMIGRNKRAVFGYIKDRVW